MASIVHLIVAEGVRSTTIQSSVDLVHLSTSSSRYGVEAGEHAVLGGRTPLSLIQAHVPSVSSEATVRTGGESSTKSPCLSARRKRRHQRSHFQDPGRRSVRIQDGKPSGALPARGSQGFHAPII
ncbi:hypothetical protein PSTG_02902 [Puccinia striiformis f. sp. tritici PST-78]|uniref:Uncharacterized protein n=1 Tax=Puccinia striiformis f. sp. tritici PST-78 TaxID=1165861 RepID=A0A0L0VX18_9BASI|nr:hypothetical protein PSTG_02902 [Puccinia striiformis f. sp. tritici PST-78]